MSYWLGVALKEARQAQNIPIRTLAGILQMDYRTLEALEGDLGEEKQTYQNVDRRIAAYGYVLGYDDPREVWIDALERWYSHGGVPNISDGLPEQALSFLRPLREQARRQRQAQPAPVERLQAIRRRQKRVNG
jgi:hypothetical protein